MSFAVDLYRGGDYVKRGDDDALIATVDRIYYRLVGPVEAYFEYGPVREQATGYPTDDHFGGSMTQLKNSKQVRLTIKAVDAKGYEVSDDPNVTSDDITWDVADRSVVDLSTIDARNVDVIAGNDGSTVVTATLPNGVAVTQAFDVIPGDATAMEFTVGEPTDQGGATPPPPVVAP